MDFIKENLKEVVTPETVTDLIVFEKGSNIPKRIKKNSYINKDYKEFNFFITQASSDAPILNIHVNELGEVPTSVYGSTGGYSIQFVSPVIKEGKTYVFGNTRQVNVERVSNNSLSITSFDSDLVTSADDILNLGISVRVYN